MPRIEEFDWYTVQNIQNEINDVLRQIGEAHGVNIELQRIKFDRLGFRGYLEAQVVAEGKYGGQHIDWQKKYTDDFVRNYAVLGFSANHLGQTFNIGGKPYKLIGLQSRAKKYKIVGESTNGRHYRFTVSAVKLAWRML